MDALKDRIYHTLYATNHPPRTRTQPMQVIAVGNLPLSHRVAPASPAHSRYRTRLARLRLNPPSVLFGGMVQARRQEMAKPAKRK